MTEYVRKFDPLSYVGGGNGVEIEPPDGEGWVLVQTVSITQGLVHIWRRG